MKLSIIIPNYNGEKIIGESLNKIIIAAEHCLNKQKENIEIVIVDDKSTDKSISVINDFLAVKRQNNILFKIIQNEKNLGFSSTINKGVKNANGEIAILLNTDVLPEKTFLIPLLEHFKEKSVFAVGCMDQSKEAGKIIFRGRGIGRWERGFLIHSRGEVNKTNTLWVSCGSGAFRKTIWEKLGGTNILYNPFYWEDIDLSYRALKSGYKIFFEPKSLVLHEHEKGAIKNKYKKIQIITIAYKNQFIFAWKNLTDLKLQLNHILWLPYHFLKALINKDLAFFLGFFQALIILPKIYHSKIKEKKLYIKSDEKVVREFSV